jgi:Zn-dependent protease with chaperone function
MIPALSLAAVTLGSGIFTWLMLHLSLIPWRRSIGQHWTERARLLWPARYSAVWISLAVVVLAYLACDAAGIELPLLQIGAGVIVGLLLGTFPFSREIEANCTFPLWARQTFWTLALRLGPFVILLGLAVKMPEEMDLSAWWLGGFGFLAAAFINSCVWLPLFSQKNTKSESLAQMAGRLNRIAAEATETTGVKPRYVWVAQSTMSNAFALPFIRSVAFTSTAMEALEDDGIRAIMIHEYEHLREPWTVALARLVGSLSYFVFLFVNPVIHAWGLNGLFVLFAAFFIIRQLVSVLQRRMEVRADHAASGSTENSPVYATALEALYRAGNIPAVTPGRHPTHPHLYDRMVAAGVTPDYPRPAAPARFSWPGLLCLAIAVGGFVLLVSGWGQDVEL